MNIIGINGFKRSGKGETGKAVAVLLPNVQQLGFADKLKVLAAQSLGYTGTREELIAKMDVLKDKHYLQIRALGNNHRIAKTTGRSYLQQMGTRARELFGEDFWVDQVLPEPTPGYQYADLELAHRYPGVETLVFTDLRFPNEAERIRALGGRVIEVVRPNVTSDGHDSEVPLPPSLIDYQIVNDADLSTLLMQVDGALEILFPDVVR